MKVSSFAEFWRLQGHQVIETDNCFWYDVQPFFFMSLPYHWTVSPSPVELRQVLLGGPAVALRFPDGARDQEEKDGGIFLCSEEEYDLYTLHKKARNQTRRGLEDCRIEQVEFDYLADNGHDVNVDMFSRQERAPDTITRQEWRRYCDAAGQIPGFEAWAAFVDDRLVALMVTALVEDCLNILHQSSRTEALEYYPNNALIFTVTQRKLSSPEVGVVSYGLKSLEDNPGLMRFKERMGFELKPFHEGIVFNPILRPFLRVGGRQLIDWMARRRPESDLWRKASSTVNLAMGD